jgi:hypothetical protein
LATKSDNAIVNHNSQTTQKFAFDIVTPQRTFFICAATDVEKKDWVDHIVHVIANFEMN